MTDPPTEEMGVILRFAEDADRPYVASTWLRNYRQGPWARYVDKDLFFRCHSILVNQLLDDDGAVLVCPREHPTLILGFACGRVYNDAILMHYVYVKDRMRRGGLAKFLMSVYGNAPVIATHWTRSADLVARGRPVAYNPYLLNESFRSKLDGSETGRGPEL